MKKVSVFTLCILLALSLVACTTGTGAVKNPFQVKVFEEIVEPEPDPITDPDPGTDPVTDPEPPDPEGRETFTVQEISYSIPEGWETESQEHGYLHIAPDTLLPDIMGSSAGPASMGNLDDPDNFDTFVNSYILRLEGYYDDFELIENSEATIAGQRAARLEYTITEDSMTYYFDEYVTYYNGNEYYFMFYAFLLGFTNTEREAIVASMQIV